MAHLSSIEYTDAAIPTIKYLIPLQGGIGVGFDPNSRHGIVKYLILLQQAQASVVHQHTPVLAAPDLVAPNHRVASGPDLDPGIKVIEDIIVFQLAMAVIVKVNAHLFPGMDAVSPEHRSGSGSDPNPG